MIVDARQLDPDSTINTAVCIVGGGAAGITLALDLAEKGVDVVLLEGGGLKPDPVTQQLYVGDNIGLSPDRPDESRSRYLGGSTNCWGGWCRPLDDLDFEARPWMDGSGWPIGKADLAPYYLRSQDWLQLSTRGYDLSEWSEDIESRNGLLLPLVDTDVQNMLTQLSPPTRFGTRYRDRLKAAARLQLMLFANATKIVTDDTASTVSEIEVRTLNGKRFAVNANEFVLASGGIENPRLLLLSNQVQAAGLGNGRNVVGRYYMDHPRIESHHFVLQDANRYRALYDATLHRIHSGTGMVKRDIEVHLAPTEAAQRQYRLPNSRTYLVARHSHDLTKSFFALKAVKRAITGRRHFGYPRSRVVADVLRQLPTLLLHAPSSALTVADVRFNAIRERRDYSLETVFEPVPNRQSRVTLSDKRDTLDLPQVVIDWQLTETDRTNFERLTNIVLNDLSRVGAISDLDNDPRYAANWPNDVVGCWHHMGTTRMSADPAFGVVDADCRVHGVSNLYIAGSSVFPTVGSDSPTITLVALALRLADRIRGQLAHGNLIQRGQADAA